MGRKGQANGSYKFIICSINYQHMKLIRFNAENCLSNHKDRSVDREGASQWYIWSFDNMDDNNVWNCFETDWETANKTTLWAEREKANGSYSFLIGNKCNINGWNCFKTDWETADKIVRTGWAYQEQAIGSYRPIIQGIRYINTWACSESAGNRKITNEIKGATLWAERG